MSVLVENLIISQYIYLWSLLILRLSIKASVYRKDPAMEKMHLNNRSRKESSNTLGNSPSSL